MNEPKKTRIQTKQIIYPIPPDVLFALVQVNMITSFSRP
jgi:hypothetical protein